jgi:hypothetical protein
MGTRRLRPGFRPAAQVAIGELYRAVHRLRRAVPAACAHQPLLRSPAASPLIVRWIALRERASVAPAR